MKIDLEYIEELQKRHDELLSLVQNNLGVNVDMRDMRFPDTCMKTLAERLNAKLRTIDGPVELRWFNVPNAKTNPLRERGFFAVNKL